MPPATTKRRVSIASKNGRVLTAKDLPERTYQAIHSLPHGVRQKTLQGLLKAAAVYAKTAGPDWYADVLAGKIELVRS